MNDDLQGDEETPNWKLITIWKTFVLKLYFMLTGA